MVEIGSYSILDILNGVKVLLLAVCIRSLTLPFDGLLEMLPYLETWGVLTKELGLLLVLRKAISCLREAIVV